MRRITMMVAAAACLATPAVSAAQRAEVIAQGAKIRVSTSGTAPHVGHLDSLTGATLAMSRSTGNVRAPSYAIPRAQVLGLEVRRKSHVRGALAGGALGFLAGVVTGFALGVLTFEGEENCFIFCTPTESGMMGGLVGAVVVTPIGIIGGAAKGVEIWKRVDPASATMP